MRSTFQNSGTALSIGVFFSLMIAGLASSLPQSLTSGLVRHGVPHSVAAPAGSLPPVSSLFAAVLGVNPIQHLLAAAGVLARLPAGARRILTGREFFPQLISEPFHNGLTVVFAVAAVLAAVASLLRGGRYVHPELGTGAPAPGHPAPAGPARTALTSERTTSHTTGTAGASRARYPTTEEEHDGPVHPGPKPAPPRARLPRSAGHRRDGRPGCGRAREQRPADLPPARRDRHHGRPLAMLGKSR
jgi:hypothetical protein